MARIHARIGGNGSMRTERLRNVTALVVILGIVAIGGLSSSGCTSTGTGGDTSGVGGAVLTGAGGWMGPAPLPCDAFAAGGGPCVAAHSTVRALYSAYNGPLYQ